MPVEVAYVTDEWLDAIWENYSREHLAKVIGQAPGFSLDSIYTSVAKQRLQLWLVCIDAIPVASFTTCIQVYPERKELECVHLGGERMAEWGADAVGILEKFAKANECKALVTIGRKGTQRLYDKWGFTFDAVVMKRNIE